MIRREETEITEVVYTVPKTEFARDGKSEKGLTERDRQICMLGCSC